jgi:hypothetical protein
MADRSRPILDHEDQLDLLSRAPRTEPDDLVVVLKRVGRELRKARELKGAQLGDVSRAVNIHPSYLAAIEDGRVEDLPGRAFTIGYMARYARHLDVDVEHAVDRLRGKIALGVPVLDDHVDVTPLPDRNMRPAVIAIAVFVLAAATYSARDLVSFATGPYEQAVTGEGPVDTRRPAEEQTRVALAPPMPPPATIAVTPPASLRADLAPAVIADQIRIARMPLPVRVAVTPPASLRADLTPAAIRQQTRVMALLPMPLPASVAVTSPASLRADLVPAVIAEQIRIARIPLPARIAVTPPASLRADLTPAAIEEARMAAIPVEPGIAVTRPASPRPDLTPAAIAQELVIAAIPLLSEIAVTPPRPLRADLAPAALRELPRVAALFPMPLPAKIAVTPPATVPRDLDPAAIAEETRIASAPLLTRVSVSPRVSPGADEAESAQAQLPPGNRLGLRNRDSRITLRVHGPTFVAVRDARGRIFLERRLAPGDTYRVPNRANLRLTTRDGGAVEVILDGDSLGFAGSRGLQTNELALNPQTIADRLRRF